MAGGKLDEQAHPSKEYDRPSSGYDPVQEEEKDRINLEMWNRDEEQDLQCTSPNGNAGGQEEESGYTTPGMLNMDVENQLLGPPPNGTATEREREPVHFMTIKQRLLSFYYKHKKAILGIVFFLIFGFGFLLGILVPLNCQKDAIKCPADWIGYQAHCYNFSREERTWADSQKVCISHSASLAKITDEDKAFVRKLAGHDVFWIGLKRKPDQSWKWLDGENSTLGVTGNGGDCAYLDDDPSPNSGTCGIKHRYICKKNLIHRLSVPYGS